MKRARSCSVQSRRKRVSRRRRPGRSYRRRNNRRKMNIMSCPTMAPNKMRVALTLCTFGNVVVTGTSSGIKLYASGRPLREVFGTPIPAIDPQGYDQWCGFYENYRLLGMTYSFQLSRISSDATSGLVRITDMWSTDTAEPGISQRYNDRFTKVRNLSSNGAITRYKKRIRPWKILGMSYRQWYDNWECCGSAGPPPGVPAIVPYGYISLSSPGNISVSVEYTWRAKMYFEFFDQKTVVDV